jgi:hypothetical protein
MDDLDRTQVEQILKLTKENNRMLHSMRRNAWLGGIFKLFLWAGFIFIPLWLYMQYMAPIVGTMMQTLDQLQRVQGAGSQVQAQFGDLNASLGKLKEQFPQFFQTQ